MFEPVKPNQAYFNKISGIVEDSEDDEFSKEADIDEDEDMDFYDLTDSEIKDMLFKKTRVAIIEAYTNHPEPKIAINQIIDWALEEKFAEFFVKEVSKVLTKLDAKYAMEKLGRILQTKPNIQAEVIINILRHIELGDLPIDEQGLEYMGNQYDLTTHNSGQNVARRFTSDGKIAIFGQNRELSCYFQTEAPFQDINVVPELKELEVDDLFFQNPDSSTDEIKAQEKQKQEFIQAYYHFIHGEVFETTGVYLADLDLPEQSAFVNLYKQLNPEDKKNLIVLIKYNGVAGVRVLLSLKNSAKDFRKIIDIDNHISRSKDIFLDYSNIIESARKIQKVIGPHLQKRLGSEFNTQEWVWRLLQPGAELIVGLHDKAIKLRDERQASFKASGYKDYNDNVYDELINKANPNAHSLSLKNCHDALLQQAATDLANTFNAEEIRVILDELGPDAGDLKRYLSPEVPGEAVEDLKRLYGKIQFETYTLNEEMQSQELALLKELIPKEESVLDAGCGTGRFLTTLYQQGYDVHGIDLSPRHVKMVQEHVEKERVREADWTDTPYADKQFETVMSMGRNILHESRIDRQNALFQEMNRILKQGGKFIFDIPNRALKGSHYQTLVKAYGEQMQKKGITNTRYGTIFDSPDNKHFATRYAYSHDDIVTLAANNGFVIDEVRRTELPTGKHGTDQNMTDQNVYYILRKVGSAKEDIKTAYQEAA